MDKRPFTRKELSRYNGQNGARALVACEGKVYDVSRSSLWRHGRHQVLHTAGTDLTGSLAEAPHGAELLSTFPIVGELVDNE